MVLSSEQIKEMDSQTIYVDFADIKKHIIAISIKEDKIINQNNGVIVTVKDYHSNEIALQTVFSPYDFYFDTVQYITFLHLDTGRYDISIKQWVRDGITLKDTTWFEQTQTYSGLE
jgi:hypothetical protein